MVTVIVCLRYSGHTLFLFLYFFALNQHYIAINADLPVRDLKKQKKKKRVCLQNCRDFILEFKIRSYIFFNNILIRPSIKQMIHKETGVQ